MRARNVLGTAVVLSLLAAVFPAAAQIVIDDFSVAQGTITATDGGTNPNSSGATGATSAIIGGGRFMRVSTSAGGGGTMSAVVASGAFTFTRPALGAGTAELWWDGNSDSTFGYTLGANLTTGGQNGIRITFTASDSASFQMGIRVSTDGSNFSQRTFNVAAGGSTVDLPFATGWTNTGTGANFASVGNIYLYVVQVVGAWSATISDVSTTNAAPVELQRFGVN